MIGITTLVLSGVGFLLCVLLILLAAFAPTFEPTILKGVVVGGFFVVAFPAVSVINSAMRDYPGEQYSKLMIAGCPPWLKRLMYASLAIGFVLFISPELLGIPMPASGIGGVGATIALGGFGLILFSALYAQVYSALRLPEVAALRRCENGHPVSPTAKYCEECGRPVRGAV